MKIYKNISYNEWETAATKPDTIGQDCMYISATMARRKDFPGLYRNQHDKIVVKAILHSVFSYRSGRFYHHGRIISFIFRP